MTHQLSSDAGDSDSFERSASPLGSVIVSMLRPPRELMALSEVLESSPIDLKSLAGVAERHPDFTSELLRLCNSPILSLAEPGTSLDHAAIVLGAEVVRTVSLACGLVDQISHSLPTGVAQAYWQHGLMVALVSERIAWRMHYPPMEAYLAGLLHDVGRVPFLIAENENGNAEAFLRLPESPQAEEEKFGVDHCELGRRIGIAWRFSNPLLDVFSRHHRLPVQPGDSELVRIVTEAESLFAGCSLANELLTTQQPEQGQNRTIPNARSLQSGSQQSLRLIDLLGLGLLQDPRRLKRPLHHTDLPRFTQQLPTEA
jgi:HD-like signal output (HDOD) protein